jgi:ABC-2 type transport system ATP-binding protein
MRLLKKIVLGAIGGILAVYLLFAIGLTALEWIVRENPAVEESLEAHSTAPHRLTHFDQGAASLHRRLELIQSATKTFGTHVAVDHLDLKVPQAAVYGFIGPNGSGKTTTLRMIMRIFDPDSGQDIVLGERSGKTANDRVGYLPEERGLYRKMRVRDVLEYHAHLKSVRHSRREVSAWLKRLDLSEWANKRVDALSKGMSQKVQFIAAVIARPQLLILDEPFSGLDPVNMELLKDIIVSLRDEGTTVLFSTHDMGVAERMCDMICMIFKSKKVLDGPLDVIQRQYGEDTIRVRVADRFIAMDEIPGVERVNDYGRYQELRVKPDADSKQILEHLLTRTAVEYFERASPSLHDIFVRVAGPQAEEAGEKVYA